MIVVYHTELPDTEHVKTSKFPGCLISRSNDINCPPKSYDLKYYTELWVCRRGVKHRIHLIKLNSLIMTNLFLPSAYCGKKVPGINPHDIPAGATKRKF